MGALGLNSATREVDDHTQRLRVADAGWFRWAPVVAVSVAAHAVGAAALGRFPAGGSEGGPLRWLRVALTGCAIALTAESGRSGRHVARAGDVPVATAVQPIADTPEDVAAAQRRLRWAQWLVPASTGLLWLLDALQKED